MPYELSLITVRPATTPKALEALEQWLAKTKSKLLACWFSEIGALNQILVIRSFQDEAAIAAERHAVALSESAFGIGEFLVAASSDTFVQFPFLDPIQPGSIGPYFEVRSYVLKPDGMAATVELWRRSVPGRATLSPVLAALYSASGQHHRFVHIWPYRSLDDRHRIRAQAVEAGLWPPPGGPDHLISQQTDIYLPASFSPLR